MSLVKIVLPWELSLQSELHWKSFNCSQCRQGCHETGMLKVTGETQRAVMKDHGKPETISEEKKDDEKGNHLYNFVLCLIMFCVISWSTSFQIQTFYQALKSVDINNSEKQ